MARVPVSPTSLCGLLFSAGMTITALSIDTFRENVGVIEAFYFRKAVQPALFIQAIQGMLLALGTLNYAMALINAASSSAGAMRKLFDVLGAVIFAANIILSLVTIAPLERRVGATFTSDAVPSTEDLDWLFNYHFLSLGIMGMIGFCQAMSYSSSLADERKAGGENKTKKTD